MKAATKISTIVILGALAAPQATALEYEVNFGYVAERTDNIARSLEDEESDIIHRPQLNVAVEHSAPKLDLAANYNAERRIFSEDVFDDENVVSGLLELAWRPFSQNVEFRATNSRIESAINQVDADTQDNRQVLESTTVGPFIRIPVGSGDAIEASYLWEAFDADQTENNGIRHQANLGYVLALSPETRWSFAIAGSQTQLEDPLSPDIELISGSIGYNSASQSYDIEASVGFAEITRTLGREDVSGAIYNIDLVYFLSSNRSISLTANRGFNDGTRRARPDADFVREIDDLELVDDTDINELSEDTSVEIAYSHAFGRNELQLFGSQFDSEFEDVERDRELQRAGVSLDRRLNRTTNLSLFLDFSRRDFAEIDGEEEDIRVGLTTNWQASPKLSLNAGIRHVERDSDQVGLGYEELRYFVGFDYMLLNNR